jgi:hypothetical protein
MSLNMLQYVENFNDQENILGNYLRDEDICTQIMLSSQFVDFKSKFDVSRIII